MARGSTLCHTNILQSLINAISKQFDYVTANLIRYPTLDSNLEKNKSRNEQSGKKAPAYFSLRKRPMTSGRREIGAVKHLEMPQIDLSIRTCTPDALKSKRYAKTALTEISISR